jgi:hypothetical protein
MLEIGAYTKFMALFLGEHGMYLLTIKHDRISPETLQNIYSLASI